MSARACALLVLFFFPRSFERAAEQESGSVSKRRGSTTARERKTLAATQPTHAAVRFWGGREVYTTNEKLFSFLQAILFFLAHAFLVSASASYVPSTGAQMGDDTRRRLRARASSGDSCASGLEATEEAVVEVAVVKEMVKEKKKNNYIVSYITYPNKKPAK